VTQEHVILLTDMVYTDRRSTKTGNNYRAADIEAILYTADGKPHVFRAMMMPPRGEQGVDLKAGKYEPVWEVQTNERGDLTLKIRGLRNFVAAVQPIVKAA